MTNENVWCNVHCILYSNMNDIMIYQNLYSDEYNNVVKLPIHIYIDRYSIYIYIIYIYRDGI